MFIIEPNLFFIHTEMGILSKYMFNRDFPIEI